jgi:RHS repeat-associated protein
VALAANGETGLIGGSADNVNAGAAWAFAYGFAPEELYGPENPGEPNQPRPCVAHPVNCATGNQVETQTDLSIGGRGPGLQLTRTYNSQLAAQGALGPFGYGWTSPYGSHIEVNEEVGAATVHHANGSTVTFHATQSKTYAGAGPWVQATLAKSEGTYTYTLPNQSKMTFNGEGKIIAEADRNGNALTMNYNAEGFLESVADSAGRTLSFTYNTEGQVESVEDPIGRKVKYTYEAGNLKTVTEPGEASPRWKFEYDPSHQMTAMTDGRGHTITSEYDGSNRVTAQTDALERKHKWTYATTALGTETMVTEPNGAVTTEQFNSIGLPTSITHASGTALAATTTYEYDAANNLVAEIDPNKHTTTYGYDAAGNRTSVTDPNGNQIKLTYDNTHDVEITTTPKGETTLIKRESHGNPESIERSAPGGKTQKTIYKYNTQGDLIGETDPLERTRTYEYNKQGDRESETDPEGDKRTWAYNKDSQETATVSPRGNVKGAEAEKYTTKIERDEQGRPLTITDPLGHTTTYAYDGDGNLETLTDGNGHKTTYIYNADDQQTAVKAPNGAVTETEYDSAGRVIGHIDGNKHTAKYVRNLLGDLIEEVDALGRKTVKEYDLVGNQTKLTDPQGRSTTFTYDPGNRLKEVSYSDGKTPTTKYEYDKDGNRTGMTDGTGKTTYTLDQLDRLTQTTDGHGDSLAYAYDLGNEQTKITYLGKNTVTSGYDKAGRTQTVTDWLGHQTKLLYDANSNLIATTFPKETGDQDKYAYNEANQMSEIRMTKSAETLASLIYTRNNDGQLKKAIVKGLPGEEATEYTYDENSRLSKAGSTPYEYDAADNPTKLAANTYTYDSADEMETGTGMEYGYDKLGERVTATPKGGQTTTYGYNQAGELAQVKQGKAGGLNVNYAYDGNGLRASQTKGKVTNSLTWDISKSSPLMLNDGVNSYVYGPGNIPIEQINGEGKVLYLHPDQQGSTRMLTGSSGNSEATMTYDAYGNTTATKGTATTPLGYDSQYTNADTGLLYLRARAYDPATAQFLTTDPLVRRTHTPYSYAADNPLSYGDPTGREVVPLPLPAPVAGACAAQPEICIGLGIGAGAILGHEELENIISSITGEDESIEEVSEELRELEEYCEQTNPEDRVPTGAKPPLAAYRDLAKKTGIPVHKLKEALHVLKRGMPANANTRIDSEGNVYDEATGELIGNLIDEANG